MHQLQKEGPSIFASTTDKSRDLSLKRCKQGRKPGIWAMSVPISSWRFCIWVVFQISNFSLQKRWTQWGKDLSPFAAPLSSSVLFDHTWWSSFFTCKSTRFYQKKTLYPDSTHGVSTGFCYIQVVCQTCLWRNGCYRIIPCILYTISDLKKNQDSQSIRTPICFYTLIFVASNGLHKMHLPSPQIGFLEPFHRDPLKGCARRRSATAKLVLGIA